MITAANMLNRRILVIDDNPEIHGVFCRILRGDERASDLREARAALFENAPPETTQEAFEVDCADQGQTGFSMVQSAVQHGRPYAVAFVDMRMPPGWDGAETLEHLWHIDPDLQAVICTAFSDLDWDHIIQRLGHSDQLLILRKPFDVVEVWQLARALTQKWSLAQQAKHRLDTLAEMVDQRTQELREVNARLQRDIARRQQVEAALRGGPRDHFYDYTAPRGCWRDGLRLPLFLFLCSGEVHSPQRCSGNPISQTPRCSSAS